MRGRSHRQLFSVMQNDLLYIMPHPAPQRDRTTIAMIMRGNRSATDNIWPEAARGHLARGRISGQRLCDRPRTVSSKARGPTKESKQRQGPSLIVSFISDYFPLQLIVRRVAVRFVGPCCWRGAQARTDHLGEEPFLPFVVRTRVLPSRCGFVPAAIHAPPFGGQACGTNLSPFRPPRRRVCVFVPPRGGHANALRRIDCPLTYSAGVLRRLVYLHSCRDLGDLL